MATTSRGASVLAALKAALTASSRLVIVLGSVALIATLIGFLAWQRIVERGDYFQRRDLRALARVGIDIDNTAAGLGQAALVHFDPTAMRFSLSPLSGCLVGTIDLPTAGGGQIRVDYDFVNVDRTGRWLKKIAAEDDKAIASGGPTLPPSTGVPPAEKIPVEALPPAHPYPADRCKLQRLMTGDEQPAIRLADDGLHVDRDYRLSALLAPMIGPSEEARGGCPEPAAKAGTNRLEPPPPATPARIRNRLAARAQESLRDDAAALLAPNFDAIVCDSIDAAMKADLITISATTTGDAIGSRELTQGFSAIKLFGPAVANTAGRESRELLWQTGEQPPQLDSSTIEGANKLLLDFVANSEGSGQAPSAPRDGAGAAASDEQRKDELQRQNALPSASAARIGDLMVYQLDYVGPDGLGCAVKSPCKLVGVREAGRFDKEVRRLSGIQATWLLIAVLTAISLLPIVQLTLSKRLDPLGRPGQYGVWIGLSLLCASLTIAVLTVLATVASLKQGQAIASEQTRLLNRSLERELAETVPWISAKGRVLSSTASTSEFPAPAAVTEAPMRRGSPATVIDNVQLFGCDGRAKVDHPRWNALRQPSFGARIDDRRYFQDALNDLWLTVAKDRFVIDRVYSRPDGQRKTIIAAGPYDPSAPSPAPSADPAVLTCPAGIIAVATAYLRTFLELKLPLGYRYAVIDATLPRGPNVLFNSRRDAELIDRFQDDLDDPAGFDGLVSTARLAGTADPESLETNYQSLPVRLWTAKLDHSGGRWLLVLIEDRSQANYPMWRDALFGYLAWGTAAILAGLIGLCFFAYDRRSLDRKPSMWLWPASELCQWTRLHADDEICIKTIEAARLPYFLHVLVGVSLFLAVLVAPTSARLWLAFATTAYIAAARFTFAGTLGLDPRAARKLDLAICLVGLVFLAGTWWSLLHEGWIRLGDNWPWQWHMAGWLHLARTAIVALALLWPSWQLGSWSLELRRWLRAGPAAPATPAAAGAPPPGSIARVRRWWAAASAGLAASNIGLRVTDKGWAIALFLAAATPAAGGYLDAFDSNGHWSERAQAVLAEQRCGAIQRTIDGINRTLLRASRIASAPCASSIGPRRDPSWAGAVVRWIRYDGRAMEFSKTPPPEWHRPSFQTLPVVLALLALLGGALALFVKQFFNPSPPAAVARPQLTPSVVAAAIGAIGADPAAPPPLFNYSPFNRHLIVGADYRLQEDPDLRSSARVRLFDLLRDSWPPPTAATTEPPPPGRPQSGEKAAAAPGADAVVAYNFDAALLRTKSCDRALDQLEAIVRDQSRGHGPLHVFLLAASEPLDRIVSIRGLSGPEADTAATPGSGPTAGAPAAPCAIPVELRWAELLQGFALYSIDVSAPVTSSGLFDRELAVVDILAASRLRGSGFKPPANSSEEDIVAFVTDFLAEHYRLLWLTSTDDERVILFNLARGAHLKMRDSFALRSLQLRRLVIRAPEYRLMNRSFGRFVRSVARPQDLHDAAQKSDGGTDKVWPLLRLPFAATVAAGLLVLALVSPGDIGLAALLPAIAAALPALLTSWSQRRTTA